jgi:hypothetical protein
MSDEEKTDWGEIAIILACVLAGAAITVFFIYGVALWQIHT